MKKTFICSALAILGIQANAQVEDISVTVSPTISYNWFDNNTAIDDGIMVGGRVGFGFGEYFELRGLYEQSLDLKNTIKEIDAISDQVANDFKSRKVEVKRYGGEMKANIPTGGSFAPYLTLGTGVQELRLKNEGANKKDSKSEQIYVAAGLGTKINLGDRIVLNIEGKNTAFNLDNSSVLFVPGDQNEYIDKSKEDRMYNWSVLAGLQIYLGGRQPGELSDLDRAYLRKFSGGLSGFKFNVEPGVAYIDFNKNLNLKDTYLAGGSVGFDFNQFVGLRGFYYQATRNEKLKKFDNLAMYGGDIVAQLNVSRGITPYITMGGGYINAYENTYTGKNGLKGDNSSWFAKGGLGLIVPVSKYFELFGAANALYTTGKKAENLPKLESPDELQQSVMYNAGLRFNIGAPSNEDEILNRKLNRHSDVEGRSNELERELRDAYRTGDTDRAIIILREKKRLDDGRYNRYNDESRVRMTPQELEDLVEKVINEVDADFKKEDVESRVNRLENLLLRVNENNYSVNETVKSNSTDKILAELQKLNAKVDRNSEKISMLNTVPGDKTVIVNGKEETAQAAQTVPTKGADTEYIKTTTVDGEKGIATSILVNKGLSLDAGYIFGDGGAMRIGLRSHYGLTDSNIEFQPGIFFGVAGDNAFGANLNAVYNFSINNDMVKPYAGIGVGYNSLNGNHAFGGNLVVGTAINVLDGKLYVDYAGLNLFDMNSVQVGYKFGF